MSNEDFSQAFKSARGKIRQQARDLERSALAGVTSHRERRRIKRLADEARDRAIKDLTTEYKANPNKSDYESDIQQRGIDQFEAPEASEKDEDTTIVDSSELPSGSNGDILYYNGGWTTLAAGPEGSVLRSDGSGLYWDTPATCE